MNSDDEKQMGRFFREAHESANSESGKAENMNRRERSEWVERMLAAQQLASQDFYKELAASHRAAPPKIEDDEKRALRAEVKELRERLSGQMAALADGCRAIGDQAKQIEELRSINAEFGPALEQAVMAELREMEWANKAERQLAEVRREYTPEVADLKQEIKRLEGVLVERGYSTPSEDINSLLAICEAERDEINRLLVLLDRNGIEHKVNTLSAFETLGDWCQRVGHSPANEVAQCLYAALKEGQR
jgi:hypothetical protein